MQMCKRKFFPEGERHPYGISRQHRGQLQLDIQHNDELKQHKGNIKQVLCQAYIEKLKTELVGLGQEVA